MPTTYTNERREAIVYLARKKRIWDTESLLVVAQEQALETYHIGFGYISYGIRGKCKICKISEEIVVHMVASSSILANQEYLDRQKAKINIYKVQPHSAIDCE